MLPYALKVENVYKSFVEGFFLSKATKEETALLRGIDFEISAGKATVLLGDNGTGKTTLFNLISGFQHPDKGAIFLGNCKEITHLSPTAIAKLGVGRLFQENHIFPELSIMENLVIADINDYGELPFQALFNPKKLKRVETDKIRRAEEALGRVFSKNNAIWNQRHEQAGNFSFGQLKLLSICRLLLNKYSVLLLDEPSAGLNSLAILRVTDILKELLNDGQVTIFMIEHNRDLIEKISNNCITLKEGKVS